ncbi:leucine-rich repeat-containing protein 25 isoform X2 [Eublepharis macularius]|uniref:Leucine-rich repeat-containing protein 25 isoform X2 n=1 Tax=Eublepharis macularius TaxID=481883 RepID=A0AA97JBS7_EUBMA|nr:leucine-rich repeat-containing protein 25 isoform X2 [Eublepharis macularius]
MHGLLVALLLLHLGAPSGAECPPAHLVNRTSSWAALTWEWLDASQTCMNISGKNVSSIHGRPQPGSQLRELDLSHNRLSRLPSDFLSSTEKLELLFLQGNSLPELPPAFFGQTSHLKGLKLEDNPLPSVPASLFRLCLETLSVDCRCDVARDISSYCQRRNCTRSISCHCSSPQGFLNVTDFYAQQCQGFSVALYAAIVVPILVLLLGATVVYVLIRRKKGATTVQEKRDSSISNGAQPRYISHISPQINPAKDVGGHADYENIFIGAPQESRGGHKERYSRKPPKSSISSLEG